ncbi:M23 family metallopeptidase [Streptomyces sp. SPB074]|uniref:M23 family metallopeptidase n=1 Tax=Streptomyces sp. (strain SPB074) TaxID=465543 RepID=UPI00017F1A05|nr:M23 family metallopeptidase [Streptomyces sp. SPB074]EDY46873.1 peptidase [Streptomyces sp. SPB074]
MPKSTTSSNARTTARLRNRAAFMAAGVGAVAVLGAGAAVAADTGTQTSKVIPAVSATGVSAQADAQSKAAALAVKTKAAHAKTAKSWIDPVKKYELSASFGNDGSRWAHKHSGQDFAVPTGTNVMAAHSGTVVKAGPIGAGDGPAYGNAIVIKHGYKLYSQYAHLSKIDVKVGQTVKTGQHLAESGSTGNSSGPHLHFEIRTTPNYGSAVNPVNFLHKMGVKV